MRKLLSMLLVVCLVASMFTMALSSVSAATTQTEQVADSGVTFKLTDNFNWGSAKVYAWDANNNSLTGAWPGNINAQTTTNDYGERQFIITVPAGAVGVIVNNGNGAQTEDIKDFGSYEGYWMSGEQDNQGHYKVTGYNPITQTTTAAPQQGTTAAQGATAAPSTGTITVYYTDGLGWGSANVYAWDASDNALVGAWPGKAMTVSEADNGFGQKVYKAEIPANTAGIVFNGGNGQTVDIKTAIADGTQWYPTGEYDNGNAKVEAIAAPVQGTTSAPVEGTTAAAPTGTVTFKLTDNFNWGSAKVYAWDANNNELTGAWPGNVNAQTTTNDYGERQFIITVPASAAGVIVNHDGAQTEDIKTIGQFEGYWMDGTQNELGHYKVTGYNPITPTGTTAAPQQGTTVAPTGTVTFKLTDNFNWGSAKVYAWDANNNELFGAWPGNVDAQKTTNDFGETQFIVTVPASAAGVIINHDGAQTEDIKTIGQFEGYWMDGSQDDQGHYKVTGYNPITPVQPTTAQPTTVAPTTVKPEEPTTVKPEEPTTVKPEEPTTVKPEEPTTVPGPDPDFTGIEYYDDGTARYFENGVGVNPGLILVDGDYYCTTTGGWLVKGTKTLYASRTNGLLPAGTYTFGDDFKLVQSAEVKNGVVDGVYYENDVAVNKGLVQVGNDFYYTTTGGRIVYGDQTIYSSRTNGLLPAGVTYHFDEVTGKLYKDNVIINDVYYKEGAPANVGIVKVAGAFYVTTTKGVITKNAENKYIASTRTNGLVAVGYYDFGPDGKMILRNGIIGGKYYVNGKATNVGLFEYEIDGVTSIYCTTTGGVLLKNVTDKYIAKSRTNNLVPAGYYSFDSEGKMIG